MTKPSARSGFAAAACGAILLLAGAAGAQQNGSGITQDRSQERGAVRLMGEPMTLTGEIYQIADRAFRQTGERHRLILMRAMDGNKHVVDLGPVNAPAAQAVERGDEITVTVRRVERGARDLVMATLLQTGDAAYAIRGRRHQPAAAAMQGTQRQRQAQARDDLEYRQVRGEIVDVARASVRGTGRSNVLALIETPSGRRAVVDLGSGLQGATLRPGQQVAVRGQPVRLGEERTVLMAHAVRLNDRSYDVNRPMARPFEGQASAE